MTELPPTLFLLLGALVLPLIPERLRSTCFLVFPAAALLAVLGYPDGFEIQTGWLGYVLTPFRMDGWGRVFGIIFAAITLIGGVYAYHEKDLSQKVATLLYAGGALGATFAGDWLHLLIFWELMAVSSAWLIWAGRTRQAEKAGMRYFLVHLFGGALLMAGIVTHVAGGGSMALGPVAAGPASTLILLGIGLNAAIVPFHAWLADAYPKATVTGAVFMCALTTKSAVCVMGRIFPGTEILIGLGVLMVLWGSVYGLLSNDFRQVLAYSTISQVGYMVTGIGIGTDLAMAGVAAHAFCHILYKALLFMCGGAVVYVAGHGRLDRLGGLIWRLPSVFVLFLVGALAVSGAPFLNGFVSKGLILSAVSGSHLDWVYFALLAGSVGTFLHTGLRLTWLAFLGPERERLPYREVPVNMQVAMGLLAVGCLAFGLVPGWLYGLLPHPVHAHPYSLGHLAESVQLLLFALILFGWFRHRLPAANTEPLDLDVVYRRTGGAWKALILDPVLGIFGAVSRGVDFLVGRVVQLARNPLHPSLKPEVKPFSEDGERGPVGSALAICLLMVVGIALLRLF